MGRERGANGLYFPIKLRCSAAADLLTEPGLEDALARALGRAFARARSSLPSPIAVGEGISLGQPEMVGGGLGSADAATLLRLINRAIARAAAEQSLPLARRAASRSIVVPAVAEPEPSAPSPTLAAARFATGEPMGLSETVDSMRIDTVTGTYLLASYDGGTTKVPIRVGGDPFKGIMDLQRQLSGTVWELIESLKTLQVKPGWRTDLEARIVKDGEGWISDRALFVHIAAVLAGKEKPEDVPEHLKASYEEVRSHYAEKGSVFPSRKKIAAREEQLQKTLILYNIVRVQVSELDRLANAATSQGSAQLHDTLGTIAKYYLELPLLTTKPGQNLDWIENHDLRLKEIFSRLSFLVTFYSNPALAASYAVITYAKEQLPVLEENLRTVYASPLNYYGGPFLTKTLTGFRLTQSPAAQKSLRSGSEHLVAAIYAVDRYQFIASAIANIGDPPGRPEDVTRVPSVQLAQTIAAAITHLQVEVAVLALWAPLADVRSILLAHHIEMEPFRARLEALETAFAGEVKKYPHPTIESDYKGWERDVTSLLDDVRSTVFWTEVRRAAAGSIPFLILGPMAAEAAGVWIAETITEARWVIALGRAAAVTLVSIALNPPTSFTAKTAGGLGLELAFNFFTEGLGQLFQRAGKLAETSIGMRRAFLRLVSRPVISFGLTTASLTAAQAIEARATHQGGETSITELLTINTILNVLGLIIGAALHWPAKARGGGPITAIELVEFNRKKGITLDPAVAQQLLDLRLKSLAYDRGFQNMAKAAQRGTLTPAEFEAYIDEGKALGKELKDKLPGLAESLKLGVTREQIETALDERIAELDRLRQAGLNAPLQGRPELVSGLQATGVGPIWTYDPANPPPQLKDLRASFEAPGGGHRVRELAGGGWEAIDDQGRTVLEVLPAAPKVAGLLPPPLKDQVRGEQAKSGAEQVDKQSVRLELPSQLAAAVRESGEAVVRRILQVIARPEFASVAGDDPAVWDGLSNYLRLGGKPEILARAIWFQDSDGAISARVLAEMAAWDASSVRGLEGLYRIRPRTTGSQLESLFDGLAPEQTRELFSAIDMLESRSRGLRQVLGRALSGELTERDRAVQSRHQRGALGEIFRGVKLMQENPGKIIGFGVDLLVIDPVTDKPSLRFVDVAVLEPVEGKPDTPTSLLKYSFALESKETSTGRLDSRAPLELAKDIVLDAQARAASGGKPFKTFGWGIRAWELEGIAAENLKKGGNADPTTDQIDAEMREIIKKQLRSAFNKPVLKNSLTQAQVDEYKAAFEDGLPFVEFD